MCLFIERERWINFEEAFVWENHQSRKKSPKLSLLMRSGETERDTHVLVTPFGGAQYDDDDK